MPHVAWGGSFLDVFGGAGTSLDFGGYDIGTDVQQIDSAKSLFLNEFKNGVSARESFDFLISTMLEMKNLGYSFNSVFSVSYTHLTLPTSDLV